MQCQKDEFHHCPACNGRTRHRVSRERKLAPVLWCQRCFSVRVDSGCTPRPYAAEEATRAA
jgi:hypothetical protein